jgi:hypothetical protein
MTTGSEVSESGKIRLIPGVRMNVVETMKNTTS